MAADLYSYFHGGKIFITGLVAAFSSGQIIFCGREELERVRAILKMAKMSGNAVRMELIDKLLSILPPISTEPQKIVADLDYDPAEIVGKLEGFEQSATCLGINLHTLDIECGSFHYFWNHTAKKMEW